MKRDRRLSGLSAEHHHALVLARSVARGELDAAALRARHDALLEPHFEIEEELLLPPLRDGDAAAMAERTQADHDALRAHLAAGQLADYAALLGEHIRFEERELFPACEQRLPAEVLDEVARRSPPTSASRG